MHVSRTGLGGAGCGKPTIPYGVRGIGDATKSSWRLAGGVVTAQLYIGQVPRKGNQWFYTGFCRFFKGFIGFT